MNNLAAIISFLYQSARPQIDYSIENAGIGPFISYWNVATLGQQPLQATLDATAISEPFLLWVSTHGGDAELTLRRQAKEAFNRQQELEVALRAVVLVAADEVNAIRQTWTDFKTQVAAATTLADLKTRVASLPNMPQRTNDQVRTAVLGKIDAGVDT